MDQPTTARPAASPERMVRSVFTAYWLLFAGTLIAVYAPSSRRTFEAAVASAAVDTLSLLMVWLVACATAARLPLTGKHTLRNFLLTLGAAVAVLLVRIVVLRAAMSPLGWFAGEPLADTVKAMLPRNLLTFAVLWIGGWGLVHYRRVAAYELRAATLRLHLIRARLTALVGRLHPHFIGNTLHALSSLVYEAPAAARRMLSGFRTVIAAALENSDAHEVRLAEELDFTRRWLEVQEQRFVDALSFSIEADEAARHAWVPRLILQPLVENVVLHAAGGARHPVRLEVRGRVRGSELHLTVEDDGPGLTPTPAAGGSSRAPRGLGISNSRERLDVLYGDAASLVVANRSAGGVRAHVTLPLMREPVLATGTAATAANAAGHGRRGRMPSARPAEPWVIAMACGIMTLLLTAGALVPSPQPDDLARALINAVVRIGSILLPAALAFRIPGIIPLRRGLAAAAAIAAATALLAAVTMASLFARAVILTLLYEDAAFSVAEVMLTAVHVGVLMLNVLAAAYVASYIAARDEELGAIRDAEAAVLHAQQTHMTAGLELNAVNAAFDRIEAAIGHDADAAIREIAGLSQRLSAGVRVAT